MSNILKRAKIRNFESHRNTTLDFHPGVNVIVGESDQGKSGILGALEWALDLSNEVLGTSIKSNWLEEINTYVQAEFEDGILKRKRTKDFNGYILNGEKFKGFGTKTPEKIKSFINMSDINILRQDDPLFMISWKPSERGRYLNEICDMKIIDTTTSNINKEIRAENSKIKILKETLEREKSDLDDFDDLDEIEKKLSNIENKAGQIERLQRDCKELADIIENYYRIDKQRQKYSGILRFSDRIDTLLKKHQEIQSETASIMELNEYIEDLSNRIAALQSEKEAQKRIQKEFKELMPKECPLCGK